MCVLSGMYYFTIFTIYKKDLIFKTKKVLKIIRYLLMRINFRVLFNIAFWLSKIYAVFKGKMPKKSQRKSRKDPDNSVIVTF